jgi:hypothetical protein
MWKDYGDSFARFGSEKKHPSSFKITTFNHGTDPTPPHRAVKIKGNQIQKL